MCAHVVLAVFFSVSVFEIKGSGGSYIVLVCHLDVQELEDQVGLA